MDDHFRIVAENANDAIISIDADSTILSVNPAAEKIFGYSAAQLIGQNLTMLMPESLRSSHRAGLQRYIQTGRKHISWQMLELPGLHHDGHEITLEVSFGEYLQNSRPVFTAIARDVTDRKRTERHIALQLAVTNLLAESRSLDDALPLVLETICRTLGWDTANFWRVQAPADRPQAGALRLAGSWPGPPVPAELSAFSAFNQHHTFRFNSGLPGRVLAGGEPVWLPDLSQDSNFPRLPLATQAGLCSALAFPVRLNHELLGVMEIFSRKRHTPDNELLQVLAALGSQLGQFIERREAEHQLILRMRMAAFGADVGRALTGSTDLTDMLNKCASALVEHLNAAFARIWTYNESDRLLELQASAGIYTHLNGSHSRIPLGQYKIGLIALERRPYLTNQVLGDERVSDQQWVRREKMVAFAGYPLIVNDQLVGVMAIFAHQPLTSFALETMEAVSNGIALSIAKKRSEEDRLRLLHSEQIARREAELIQQRLAFLTGASATLAASLDYETSLHNLARLSVPYLADVCLVDVVAENSPGSFKRLATAYSGQTGEFLLRQIISPPPGQDQENLIARILRSAQPELLHDLDPTLLSSQTAPNSDTPPGLSHLTPAPDSAGLKIASAILAPLKSRGHILGVISFLLTAESVRQYNQAEFDLALEVARRGAVAIDNSRLYQESLDSARTLAELNRLKDTFLSIASHELRTPLTSIKGYGQLLERNLRKHRPDQNSAAASGVQLSEADLARISNLTASIIYHSNRMSGLIDEMLDSSRIQSGQLAINSQAGQDLVALVRHTIEQQQNSHPGRTIVFITPLKALPMTMDAARIEQVLNNLINNAIKYSNEADPVEVGLDYFYIPPDGSASSFEGSQLPTGLLDSASSTPPSQVLVWVKDRGQGIDPQEHGRIFDQFYRAGSAPQNQVDGLGLGLFISNQIVTLHQGRMWLKSSPGQGSTFYFTLPLH